MTRKKATQIRLGHLETQIMNIVWDLGEATVHNVKDAIGKGRTPAYSTVLTVMRKLEGKGYLQHEVDDRTYVYCATITRQAVRKGILGDLLERLFEGSPALLVNSLVEQSSMSDAELAEIKRLLKNRSK